MPRGFLNRPVSGDKSRRFGGFRSDGSSGPLIQKLCCDVGGGNQIVVGPQSILCGPQDIK